MPAIQLGPFALQRPVGRGGMGEVWRGYHTGQQIPVAVKVMHAAVFEKEANRDRFTNEVRAVAQLDHPGVVWVFDHGLVSEEASASSKGRLQVGSPYLAMELAGNGTLANLRRPLDWPEQYAILLGLLDALAHAHAHGVIHRDLKPGNVLVCGPRDLRPGIKLTDFGIAAADINPTIAREEVLGTLHYMAPEQIRGQDWNQGPHTDLYALGCLAWRLACMEVPFSGRTSVELLAAQLHHGVPTLKPVEPVPPGLQEWIETLMAKRPGDRFRMAADAADALVALSDVQPAARTAPDITSPSHAEPDAVTLIPTDTGFLEAEITVMALDVRPEAGESSPPRGRKGTVRTILPSDWRRPGSRRSIRLLGAGLGLYGVRAIPMVGRHAERDTLWRLLGQVHRTGQARAAVIRGAAGTGKSRLADWVCQRAHEVGGASVLMARFSEGDAGEEPLRRMIARHLKLGSSDDHEEVLAEALAYWGTRQPGLSHALVTLLERAEDRQPLDATSRHAMIRMVIEEIARERPVVVWLDDVQWGSDGLLFAHSILAAQAVRPAPVFLVLTAREEALAERDQEASMLNEVTEHPDCIGLTLRPLSRPDRALLVQELLGLEPALGAQVEERSGGNPLFAVQLVGDWVQRGLLVLGERGFELAPGASAQLPEDLRGVWTERTTQLLEGLPPSASWILERAAVLGHDVDQLEWAAACDDPAGVHGPGLHPVHREYARTRHALVQRLLASRLCEETETGWVFGHGMLQEALQAVARAAGRWHDHHRACARMLEGDPRDDTAERLGRHLLEALEVGRAIEPLLRGVRHRRVTVGRRSALRLVNLCASAMRQQLDDDAPEWGRLLIEKSTTLYLLGLVTEAHAVASTALEQAERNGWTAIAGLASFRLGRIALDAGEIDSAEAWLERAVQQVEHATLLAESYFFLSRICAIRLDRTQMKVLEAEAVRRIQQAPDRRAQTLGQLFLAESAWDDGDMAKCGVHARKGLDLARTLGDLGTQIRCWNFLAEAARDRRAFDEAVSHLREGIALAEMIGHARTPVLRSNLALVYLARRQYEAADSALHDALYQAWELGQAPLLASVLTLRMHAAAGREAWTAFDDFATQAERIQFDLPLGEPDCAHALESAAELARSAGHLQRSQRAWKLAHHHWQRLGRTVDMTRVSRALEALRIP